MIREFEHSSLGSRAWLTLLSLLFLFGYATALLACGRAASFDADKSTGVIETQGPTDLGPETWYVCADEPFEVDLGELLPSLPDVDVGEQREQLRDWLWTVVLARHAEEGGEAVPELTFDMRPAPWLKGELPASGLSRSAVLESRELLVMIPTDSEALMQDSLLRAFDARTLDHEDIARVVAYRYGDVDEAGRAWMCRLRELAPQRLASAEFGLRKSTVRSEAELEAVLDGGLDLLEATCSDGGLEVVGRQRTTTTAAPIVLEEVREIYKGTGGFLWVPDDLGFSLDPRWHDDVMARKLLELGDAVAAGGDLDGVFSGDIPLERWIRNFVESKHPDLREEYAAALRRLSRETARDRAQTMAKTRVAQIDARRRATLAEEAFEEVLESEEPLVSGLFIRERAMNALLRAELEHLEVVGLEYALVWAELSSLQQCARYDGPTKGTRIGMTMYYTDLLLKLANQGHILTPPAVVPEPWMAWPCESSTSENSVGRLWLDPITNDVQHYDGGLHFAPAVVRLNARQIDFEETLRRGGSDLSPEEVDPTADTQQYINRWNSARDEIFAWEPEYEHLNQIYKWNAVALAKDTRSCLEFLTSPTEVDLTLDAWVAQRPALRFRDIASLGFQPDDGECFPLIHSRESNRCGYYNGFSSGGVSAFKRGDIPKIPSKIAAPPVKLGAALEGKPITAGIEAIGSRVTPKVVGRAKLPAVAEAPSEGMLPLGREITANANADSTSLLAVIETAGTRARSAADYRFLSRVIRDVKATRLANGKDVNGLADLQMGFQIKAARAKQLVPRPEIPPGDVVRYSKPKGSAPVPGTPEAGESYYHVLLQPSVTVGERRSAAEFRNATAVSRSSTSAYRLIGVPCDIADPDCNEQN